MRNILSYIFVLIANNANIVFISQPINNASLSTTHELSCNKTKVINDNLASLFIENNDSDKDETNFSDAEFIKLFNHEFIISAQDNKIIYSNTDIFSISILLLPFILDIPPPLS